MIVLSHEPFFLKGIRDNEGAADVKTLYVARKGNGYTLREWNIEDYCLNQSHKDYFVLQRFQRDGAAPGTDLIPVARAIRPYVEGALRFLFPGSFTDDPMLGQMIARIRTATTGPLVRLQHKLDTLDDLNTYARRFQHADAASPNEPELRTYVDRVLSYVQGV